MGIEVDLSLPAERAIRSLDRIIEWRGKPVIWAEKSGITIQPGQPQQNAYIELLPDPWTDFRLI